MRRDSVMISSGMQKAFIGELESYAVQTRACVKSKIPSVFDIGWVSVWQWFYEVVHKFWLVIWITWAITPYRPAQRNFFWDEPFMHWFMDFWQSIAYVWSGIICRSCLLSNHPLSNNLSKIELTSWMIFKYTGPSSGLWYFLLKIWMWAYIM